MAVKLQVLICTFGERIASIDLSGMPELPEVEYLISWQNPEGTEVSEALERIARRSDIKVIMHADRGVARNRNHALRAAGAPYAVMSDDDVTYSAEGLRTLIEKFEADPELDYMTFRSITPEERVFPADGHDLAKPVRHYFLGGIEMAFRMSAQRKANLYFCELSGIGAPDLVAGEEDLILHSAIRKGLKCRFYDFSVATHPAPSTAEKLHATTAYVFTQGAIMAIIRGPFTALTRYPVQAYRSKLPFLTALRHYLSGFVYAIRNGKELRK